MLNRSSGSSSLRQGWSDRVGAQAIALIRAYQRTISEVTPHRCRFQPTCSEYTAEAIQRYGFAKGGWLGLARIARCHPFTRSRYDPVP